MNSTLRTIAALLMLSIGSAHAADVAAWVQYNATGAAEARVTTVGDTCPAIVIDGKSTAMERRAAADESFKVTLCSAVLPSNANRIAVNGHRLAAPKSAPTRIVVLGDTGCRLKGEAIQACNDPVKWPFAPLAKAAARLKPDLVIHVGDYLYRERDCPSGSDCAGSPSGDKWRTWQADFFDPAAPLLAAAPWVIVRGNHEDCARAGAGWSRLLGPLPFDPAHTCEAHLSPYEIALAKLTLIVMDDADAPDDKVDDAAAKTYASEFERLDIPDAPPSWLLMHRPIWGARAAPPNETANGNQTLIAALKGSRVPKRIGLMLSGHIHTFEAMNYLGNAPPQILAGNGGDTLERTPRDLKDTAFPGQSGVTVKDGLSLPGFGFLLMTRQTRDWKIDVYDVAGHKQRVCAFTGTRVNCNAH